MVQSRLIECADSVSLSDNHHWVETAPIANGRIRRSNSTRPKSASLSATVNRGYVEIVWTQLLPLHFSCLHPIISHLAPRFTSLGPPGFPHTGCGSYLASRIADYFFIHGTNDYNETPCLICTMIAENDYCDLQMHEIICNATDRERASVMGTDACFLEASSGPAKVPQ